MYVVSRESLCLLRNKVNSTFFVHIVLGYEIAATGYWWTPSSFTLRKHTQHVHCTTCRSVKLWEAKTSKSWCFSTKLHGQKATANTSGKEYLNNPTTMRLPFAFLFTLAKGNVWTHSNAYYIVYRIVPIYYITYITVCTYVEIYTTTYLHQLYILLYVTHLRCAYL